MFNAPLLGRREEVSSKLEESVLYWRKKYFEEVQLPQPPRPPHKQIRVEDFFVAKRPFFSLLDESDAFYVNIFRSIEYSSLSNNFSSKVVIMRRAGYDLGRKMVESGVVKSLDEAPLALALYRVGLLDIIKEKLNYMKLNIYECISCYGAPNINRTLCDFEAGVLQGILAKLYGPCNVREKYCFGTGYSFCGFEVFFE
ncbi:MAG: hypothetical protein LM590_07910 [Thermofilum sp.]|jgi:predicted hydrocarbon binding protein|nr:hypothetical protein [Thermofilum sp.]